MRAQYEDPLSSYSFGWSHGREAMEDGQVDSLKGSYYANPLVDNDNLPQDLRDQYPSYCRFGHSAVKSIHVTYCCTICTTLQSH